jgi:hypothetical protein
LHQLLSSIAIIAVVEAQNVASGIISSDLSPFDRAIQLAPLIVVFPAQLSAPACCLIGC